MGDSWQGDLQWIVKQVREDGMELSEAVRDFIDEWRYQEATQAKESQACALRREGK